MGLTGEPDLNSHEKKYYIAFTKSAYPLGGNLQPCYLQLSILC